MARTREPDPSGVPIEGPVRTCVGCRSRGSASELLRVVAVDGVVDPDPRRRKPGRGAWLHPDPDCLSRAERRTAFPRALRVPGPLDTARLHVLLGEPEPSDAGHRARQPSRPQPRKQVDPHEPAVKHSR